MHALDLAVSGSQLVAGPAGPMEVIVDAPRGPMHDGIAIVAHPQPLLGGHALHKVPQLLARALSDAGWRVARPNFRGVGGSAGVHDAGIGEAEDVVALHDALRGAHPGARIALVGFSFGAFVQARVARALEDRGRAAWRVCLAGMPSGTVEGGRVFDPPQGLANALIVHGERDERVALGAVLDWARPHGQPVVVVPGADHFFTGRLLILRGLVLSHLAICVPAAFPPPPP
jgi:alpha/beta superfamily hydrolase